MAEVLYGKPVVDHIAEDLRARINTLCSAGTVPTLALVRVGNRLDDVSYEKTALKQSDSLGIAIRSFVLDEQASQEDLETVLREVNNDSSIHGCLMFRPLPSHLDEVRACETLDPAKDVDGITNASLAAVFTDGEDGYPPSTAAACIELLDFYNVALEGKHVVVVGRSLVIGKPVSLMLLNRNATVTICHSRTENLPELCRSADVVICATGRACAFTAEYFSAGQTVLDVGINFDDQGKLRGDVDFDSVEPIVAALTPVPKGLGSVTTLVTMSHVVEAAEKVSTDKEEGQ